MSIVISNKYPEFIKDLSKTGKKIIFTDCVYKFSEPEQLHADMQLLQINNSIFILNECKALAEKLQAESKLEIVKCSKKAGEKYPENILLNFLFLNNVIYGKLSSIEPKLLEFCRENKIKTVNVNQGYCRCSTAVVSENAVITADESISKALSANGVEVLKISPGNIRLDGFDYGFIGGASGKISENTLVFFGNLKLHPNYKKIDCFCQKHKVKIKLIAEKLPLTDIGGIVKLD